MRTITWEAFVALYPRFNIRPKVEQGGEYDFNNDYYLQSVLEDAVNAVAGYGRAGICNADQGDYAKSDLESESSDEEEGYKGGVSSFVEKA